MRFSKSVLTIVCTVLFFTSIASAADVENATTKLIQELGLKESQHPIREASYWRKPRHIVIVMEDRQKNSKPDAVTWLQKVAPDAEFSVVDSRKDAAIFLDDADVLLGYCTDETLKSGTELRYILNYSAGVDKCVSSPLARERKFLLTNMQRIYGPGIAEHTIAMMYMLTRKLYVFHEQQRQHKWDRRVVERTAMWEVQGRTMLVVGLGGIGTEIARRASALGMRVIAIRNSSRQGPDFVDYVGLPDELHHLTAQADVIVNATPLTPATTGLFDATFFSKMKSDAYFINIGRGESVITRDLIAALNTGQIGGAAVDVMDPEPLPPDHPLWKAKNVIITPHISASSDEQMQRFWLLVRENLRRYVNGDRMLNVVDINRGY